MAVGRAVLVAVDQRCGPGGGGRGPIGFATPNTFVDSTMLASAGVFLYPKQSCTDGIPSGWRPARRRTGPWWRKRWRFCGGQRGPGRGGEGGAGQGGPGQGGLVRVGRGDNGRGNGRGNGRPGGGGDMGMGGGMAMGGGMGMEEVVAQRGE